MRTTLNETHVKVAIDIIEDVTDFLSKYANKGQPTIRITPSILEQIQFNNPSYANALNKFEKEYWLFCTSPPSLALKLAFIKLEAPAFRNED